MEKIYRCSECGKQFTKLGNVRNCIFCKSTEIKELTELLKVLTEEQRKLVEEKMKELHK